jgi:hypothetical protein
MIILSTEVTNTHLNTFTNQTIDYPLTGTKLFIQIINKPWK